MSQVNFAEITLNLITEAFEVELEAADKQEKIVELVEHLESLEESLNFFDVVEGSESYTDNDNYRALEVLVTCCNATDSDFDDLEMFELIDLIIEIKESRENANDFYIDSLPCGEVRLIEESEIEDIWTESLIGTVKECYDLSNIPSFVAIDWEQTAENCKEDGKGHHFASYDHEEHFCNGLYIFRTN